MIVETRTRKFFIHFENTIWIDVLDINIILYAAIRQ